MGELADLEDRVLVERTIAGDEEAYGELVRRYQKAAYGTALAVTRRHEDAEDAAQEAFLIALDRLEECRNRERFAGWLLTIVRNRARNLLRRESLRETDALPFDASSPRAGPDVDVERVEMREALVAALGRLSEVQRQIVLMHDLEGWKHREIAKKLGVPAGTVRSHLHYARKSLREQLNTVSGPETGEERPG